MSTLSVSNITDGTDTVETGYVVNGSAKCFGRVQQSSQSLYGTNLNVSSLTDGGVGQTDISFTSNMSDTGYATAGSTDFGANTYSQFQVRYQTTGSFRVYDSPDYSKNIADGAVGFSVHGDLA